MVRALGILSKKGMHTVGDSIQGLTWIVVMPSQASNSHVPVEVWLPGTSTSYPTMSPHRPRNPQSIVRRMVVR